MPPSVVGFHGPLKGIASSRPPESSSTARGRPDAGVPEAAESSIVGSDSR